MLELAAQVCAGDRELVPREGVRLRLPDQRCRYLCVRTLAAYIIKTWRRCKLCKLLAGACIYDLHERVESKPCCTGAHSQVRYRGNNRGKREGCAEPDPEGVRTLPVAQLAANLVVETN